MIRLLLLSYLGLFHHAHFYGQNDLLDAARNAKIRGNLYIQHATDSTSIFIGLDAGKNSTPANASNNTFIGMSSGIQASGINNTFLGAGSGFNCKGEGNSVIGIAAGRFISGDYNSFLGDEAGGFHKYGNENVFLGAYSGFPHEDGEGNTYFGSNTGYTVFFSNYGEHNTFLGSRSGSDFAFPNAGIVGSRNTYIGSSTGPVNPGDSLVKAITIGHGAKVGCNNCGVIGGIGSEAINLGINQPKPLSKLHVNGGDIRVDNGKYEGWGVLTLHPDVDNTGDNYTAFLNSNGGEVARFHSNGFLGVGTAAPNDALDVVGNIDLSGCLTTDQTNIVGGNCPSDIRLKKNVTDLESQLVKLMKLRPVRFHWKDKDTSGGKYEIGLIAQEVEKVIPEMVVTDDQGNKRIQYDISLQIRMIKALQERQLKINTQQAELDLLRGEINALKSMIEPGSN